MNYLNTLLFGVYPYLAGAVFLLGSLARFDRDPFTWKAHSSQILSNHNMRLASNLFHVGILLLFMGHFVGLLTPPEIFHALGVSAGDKQLLAIVAGSIAGIMCFVGLTLLVRRRLTDPRVRATSSRMDIFILLLLYAQLILGLLTIPVSLLHLDGHNMLNLMGWARNIVTFDPIEAVAFVSQVGWLFKLHLFLGLTVFLVFPFSRLVHIWSAPVTYPARPYQVVRQR
ncbi:MAG TPA: respiratory nitrate reductase subunit gamma [Candidatus Competibacteraceae bacterium]|nr:respiratory nitrate reductase subunit gamma [Candidatus Competibacteraceae bacterium]HQD57818.1 respiratory nitrate reductase subunit gamma [Candidatus Competibacteraceae bacterium]